MNEGIADEDPRPFIPLESLQSIFKIEIRKACEVSERKKASFKPSIRKHQRLAAAACSLKYLCMNVSMYVINATIITKKIQKLSQEINLASFTTVASRLLKLFFFHSSWALIWKAFVGFSRNFFSRSNIRNIFGSFLYQGFQTPVLLWLLKGSQCFILQVGVNSQLRRSLRTFQSETFFANQRYFQDILWPI